MNTNYYALFLLAAIATISNATCPDDLPTPTDCICGGPVFDAGNGHCSWTCLCPDNGAWATNTVDLTQGIDSCGLDNWGHVGGEMTCDVDCATGFRLQSATLTTLEFAASCSTCGSQCYNDPSCMAYECKPFEDVCKLSTAPHTFTEDVPAQATGFCAREYTVAPSVSPSQAPSVSPSVAPSYAPSASPSVEPSASPSKSPSLSPSNAPSTSPSTSQPTVGPTTSSPTRAPSARPSFSPSASPSAAPSFSPTTSQPSTTPTSSAPSASPVVADEDNSIFDDALEMKDDAVSYLPEKYQDMAPFVALGLVAVILATMCYCYCCRKKDSTKYDREFSASDIEDLSELDTDNWKHKTMLGQSEEFPAALTQVWSPNTQGELESESLEQYVFQGTLSNEQVAKSLHEQDIVLEMDL